MRKSLWIMLAALLVAIAAPSAHADSFTATFSCSGTCVGGTPTAPDVTFPAPVIDVTWNGLLFQFHLLYHAPSPQDQFSWTGFNDYDEGRDTLLQYIDITDQTTETTWSSTGYSTFANGKSSQATGALAFAAVATPEPSSYALMLLGVGLVFVLRKRIVQRLPQAG
jgi:PEP-CTERM motif